MVKSQNEKTSVENTTGKSQEKAPLKRRRVSPKSRGGKAAQQKYKSNCDINNIFKRIADTGMMPQNRPGFYADASVTSLTLKDAQQMVISARQAFDALPAKIRKEFMGEPLALATFLDNPANHARARELGILPPEEKTMPKADPESDPHKKGTE